MKIVIAILAVIGIGGVAIYVANMPKDSSEETLPQEERRLEISDNKNFDGKGPLLALLSKEASIKCEFSSVDDKRDTKGILYIDNDTGRSRLDAQSSSNSGVVDSHMVSDGEKIYMWSSDMDQGIVINADMVDNFGNKFNSSENNEQSPQIDLDQNVSYKCSSWNTQEVIFAPDSEVEFIDTSQLMKGFMEDDSMQFDPEILQNLENI